MAKIILQNKSNITPPLLFIIIILLTTLSFLDLAAADDRNHTFARNLYPKKQFKLRREKLSHLHFYFQDVVSGKHPTAVQIAGPKKANNWPRFGAVVMIDDPLTVGPDPSSKQVGRAQGMYAVSVQSDQIMGLTMILNYVFSEGKYEGSSLSILGHNPILDAVREMPIVGGSGLFRYARGYAQARTYNFNKTTFDAIVEYDVYVLHY